MAGRDRAGPSPIAADGGGAGAGRREDDRLGRDFTRLWRAYAASTLGTWLALDAFPLIAILLLHVGAAQVSMIAASGAVGALLAVPLGPWVEFQPKRRLMVRADLVRFAALLTVPVAYALDGLTFAHLLLAAMVVAVADVVFRGASGAHLKGLVPRRRLMDANGRFETVAWMSTAVGPPAGGALIGLLGPVVTVCLDAVSYVLSAWGIRAIRAPEPPPPVRGPRDAGIGEGWRAIAADATLRLLFANTVLVSALIMATAPLLTYRMLGDLGFSPLQYGLAFGVPCLGGIAGARASRRLVRRFGTRGILLGFGVARALWLVGLSIPATGLPALLLIMAVEMGMITCVGVFNPVYATERLRRTDDGRLARVLTAWTVSTRAAIAAATVLWGLLAAVTSPRIAIAVAGILLIATSLLLPWRGDGDRARRGRRSTREPPLPAARRRCW
ncbi:MFS transporter [Actinomadura graeca]|uniref:MFS transporter n=1 Tax=Actinomadura graeca TaxID=2750812 RepID=A0ABX8QMC2_9ACTN|nr:MFS transporter [Actinomadura graeca]QXJ19757.1 MFS transporter [Actinomadura graeca]